MKIKCVKAECPSCKVVGSIQLFLSKDNQVKYARTRHYSHIDEDSKKPQFNYCKLEDLDLLKTLLSQLGMSVTAEAMNGQLGQNQIINNVDLDKLNSSFNQQNKAQRISSRNLRRIPFIC